MIIYACSAFKLNAFEIKGFFNESFITFLSFWFEDLTLSKVDLIKISGERLKTITTPRDLPTQYKLLPTWSTCWFLSSLLWPSGLAYHHTLAVWCHSLSKYSSHGQGSSQSSPCTTGESWQAGKIQFGIKKVNFSSFKEIHCCAQLDPRDLVPPIRWVLRLVPLKGAQPLG